MATETVTLTIQADDDQDDLTIPAALLDMLREDESEGDASVIADIALFGLGQRVHTAVHHSQGEADPELVEVHDATMDQFEDRFGQTFGELTGHDH